jgi:Glycosyl transferases group 1
MTPFGSSPADRDHERAGAVSRARARAPLTPGGALAPRRSNTIRPDPPMTRPITIATVYQPCRPGELPLLDMAAIRWLRISQHLARLKFRVDVIADTPARSAQRSDNLRFVRPSEFHPADYDVVKTLFHLGYETLSAAGGGMHPFIISKLGSVVGAEDGIPGVHFLGEKRQRLYETQVQIQQHSRYVTVLTSQSKALWESEFGVDAEIPPSNSNPYWEFAEKIAVYIGNLYAGAQKQVNLLWQRRLNALGRLLKRRGIRLCVIGPGEIEELDPTAVTYLGAVENDRIWDYHYFADVGIVLAQGDVQHNESSKIYYYLRAGLPVVSETPVPNNAVIRESGLGLIAAYGDDRMMVEMIEDAIHRKWPREEAITYVLEHHTWEKRAQLYADVIHRARGS